MAVLNELFTNIYLYWGVITGLLIVEIILTILCLKKHKRDQIKNDFLEIEKETEELAKKEEEPANNEIMAILEQMEEDSKLKPEDVVKQFEDDQELNAIISYQELLDSVNKKEIEIEENDDGDIDFVQQLEMELNDKNDNSTIIEDTMVDTNTINIENREPEKIEEEISKEESHLDVIDELNDDKKFVTSEVISPVFGRITDFTEYSLNKDNTVEVKQVAGTSTEEEIKNNEAFLKALIKFRNNL